MSMDIHTPTVSIILATLSLAMVSYLAAVTIEQQAHLNRINKTLRAMCGPNSPNHHIEACAQLSLPLDRQISPFNMLRPDPNLSPGAN